VAVRKRGLRVIIAKTRDGQFARECWREPVAVPSRVRAGTCMARRTTDRVDELCELAGVVLCNGMGRWKP
jgi:hypothetical protein